MKITFLGAAGTVTGSSYILTSDSGHSILVDLGMFQGTQEIDALNYLPYNFDVSVLRGAILTHAHLDHCGRLPILFSHGFEASIYMTPPTSDLTQISLYDSAKIAVQDKKPFLYDKELVTRTIEHFETVEYHEQYMIADFSITFVDAGHLLGSATIQIVDRSARSALNTIIFSGDLGNTPDHLLRPTEQISDSYAVVMESTYGDRLHPIEDPTKIIAEQVKEIEQSKGVLLIPAFSLDRTQEILHILMHLKKTGSIDPSLKVFMDSPMAQKATLVYGSYPDDLNTHIQEDLRSSNPFDFEGLVVVKSREESEAIQTQAGPKVIIAGSGMMSGGRIVHHAAHYLPLSTTRLLIVGFQGEGTLGRSLLQGANEFEYEGERVVVQAKIVNTQAMSSHADQAQLCSWLAHINGVQKVFLTHGEDGPRLSLKKKIQEELNISDIIMPTLGQQCEA